MENLRVIQTVYQVALMSRSLVNDCQRISRRTAFTAFAFSAAALAAATPGAAEGQPGGRQISGYAEGRPALRWLHQLPTTQCLQICPR